MNTTISLGFDRNEIYELEYNILSSIEDLHSESIDTIYELDDFVENLLFIRGGRKSVTEVLTYTKYVKKDYLLSYYYGFESFKLNKNSHGIIYSILSLLHLRLYNEAQFFYNQNEEKILEIINSNKFKVDEFIDILIYFEIPINLVDDISTKLDSLKDYRKRYIYLLINAMEESRSKILDDAKLNNIKCEKSKLYKEYMFQIMNILRDLGFYQLEYIYNMKMDNNHNEINLDNMLPCDNIPHHMGKSIIRLSEFDNDVFMPESVSKYDFKDEYVEIVTNKEGSMASLHVIKIKDKYIILDCGAEISEGSIKKIDFEKFFEENNIDSNKIIGVIVSHAHLDHYGSLGAIQKYTDNIYMTKDTFNIIKIIGEEMNAYIDKIIIKNDYDKFELDEFEIEFISSNHIKGSIGVYIKWEDKILFYTGDFSFNKQATTISINKKIISRYKNIDYLIMESTYGNKDIEIPYRYKKKLLNYFTDISVKNDIKVFMPSFAIGRAQECYDIISKSTIEGRIIVDGLAVQISDYYNKLLNEESDILNYSKNYDFEYKYNNNDIIIASGGTLNEDSASDKYYKMILNDESIVSFIKVGYIDKNTYNTKIQPYDTNKINLIDICLSAHATYNDLITTIEAIKPKNIIFVHGDGIEKYNHK